MPLMPPLPSPSAMPLLVAGMSHNSQCTNSPDGTSVFGTSGSSMMSTSACVLAGTPPKTSAGLTACGASQVYFDGMLPPALNAGLVIEGVGADGVMLKSSASVVVMVIMRMGPQYGWTGGWFTGARVQRCTGAQVHGCIGALVLFSGCNSRRHAMCRPFRG